MSAAQDNKIRQLRDQLLLLEAEFEDQSEYVGAASQLHPSNELEISVNAPAAVYLARTLLDVALSDEVGAHQHMDHLNFFEEETIRLIVGKHA